nr:hypothetical protein [Escherichia coli]
MESHLGASRLFPSEDEQQGHFRGFDGTTIKFEDVAYTDRLKAHDLMALHYRRLLIMLFGLDQRLALFGQFYPQHEKGEFLESELPGTVLPFFCTMKTAQGCWHHQTRRRSMNLLVKKTPIFNRARGCSATGVSL